MAYEKRLDELVKPEWMSDPDWKVTLDVVESLDRIKSDAKAHVARYVASNGEDGYQMPWGVTLLITTIGRKTGNKVTTALNFLQQGESYVVVGSLAGVAHDPGWALNLKQNPQAWVQVKDKKWEASVHLMDSAEREKAWPALLKAMPLWGIFEQRTDRKFPVFVLTPKK